MELYTLTKEFFPNERIDLFSSLIWTERYSSAGDVQLVVQPLPSVIAALTPGTLLGLRGQSEIMVVKTQVIENGLLTVTGSSLVEFLNERIAWFANPAYDGTDASPRFSDFIEVQKSGHFISEVVYNMVVDPVDIGSFWAPINLDWDLDKIVGLHLGHTDENGDAKQLSFPIGPLYDGVEQLAAAEQVGFKLYLESATFSSGVFVLRFATYRGKDRTSDQTANLMVRFTPQLDSLNDVKEITSSADYKNVVYVTYKNVVTEHYPSYVTVPPTGFDRRVLRVDAPDIFLEPDHIAAFRAQVARDALAHHLYIQAVDGRVSSHVNYTFGTDYYLGDIIELEGFLGTISKARVTEYIRSEDQFGEQEYPTLSVIDPLDTGFVADTEEDSSFEPPWLDDPTWTDDWTESDIGNTEDPSSDPIVQHPIPVPNPSDPYDPNPEPIPDFGLDGSGDGDGGGDGGGDGTSGDIGLTPTRPYEVTDWLYDTDIGYYVHTGTVHIVGEAIANNYDHLGSDALLVNFPPELSPTTTVTRKVLVDHSNSTLEYAYDSGLTIGPWLDVTISPGGDVMLVDGNPFRHAPADTTMLTLVLSGLSWPTAATVPDTYSPTGSFDDYIGSMGHINAIPFQSAADDAWKNIDGHYTEHNVRFHLAGKVKAWILANDYDPLINIPPARQPKLSSEIQPHHWCEVPQKDGYLFAIYTPSAGAHDLFSHGVSQNPQAAGNNGCGMWKPYFYERRSDGFLSRGSSPSLSFTPGIDDAGLSFVGCSGHPISAGGVDGGFPPSVNWRGVTYSAFVTFKLEDLIATAGPPEDFSVITGAGQFCFVMGIVSGLSSYYKIVMTYDTYYHQFYSRMFIVTAGGEQILIAEGNLNPIIASDGTCSASWTLDVSDTASDVGYSGAPVGDYNYFSLHSSPANIHGFTSLADMSAVSPGGKGDMGFHIPAGTTCHVVGASITGIGDFPEFVVNDEIDFTGCGWPLW